MSLLTAFILLCAFHLSHGKSVDVTSECRKYLVSSQPVELCRRNIPKEERLRLVSCAPGALCAAVEPSCTGARFSGDLSPYARRCLSCGGAPLVATNVATRAQDNLCRFGDGSWALSYELMAVHKRHR